MSVLRWLVVVFAGVILGVGLLVILPESRRASASGSAPHSVAHMLHSHLPPGLHGGPVFQPAPAGKSEPSSGSAPVSVGNAAPQAAAVYTPWILTVVGLGLAIGFRKDEKLLGLGVVIATSGVTALVGK